MGTSIINPEGFNAVGGLYPQKVYDNFPVMLRRLSYIYAVMSAIGALAIEPPPSVGVTDGKTPVKAAEGATVAEALKDKKFWMMWFMVRLVKLGSEDAVRHCFPLCSSSPSWRPPLAYSERCRFFSHCKRRGVSFLEITDIVDICVVNIMSS